MLEIEAPTVGSAYVFGFRKIGEVLREYWWLYALAAVVDGGLSAVGSSGSHFQGGSLSSIVATIAALATTARMVRADARIRAIDLLALCALWLVGIAIFAAAIGIAAVVALLSSGLAFFVGVAGFFAAIWLVFKFGVAQVAYVNSRKRNVGNALAKSFDALAGEYWWAFFGLAVSIMLTFFIPFALIAAAFLHAVPDATLGTRFLVDLLSAVLAVVAVVWSTASSTAFASALGILET